MFQFLFFICFPFFLMWVMGVKRAGLIGLGIAFVLAMLGLGFVTGLLINFFTQPHSYWTSYTLPTMSTTTFIDALGMNEPLYKLLYVPYIVLWDLIKIYFHVTFTHGTFVLWGCEIISIITIRNTFFSLGLILPKELKK